MNNTKFIHELSIIENSPKYLIVKEKFFELEKCARNIIIEKAKLIDDFIYKNLETNVLQAMKLKIENELLERQLKNMTDKEIIIDGVNVAGCKHIYGSIDTDYSCKINDLYLCVDCGDCDYKQLQRTQQQYNQVVDQNKSLQKELQNTKQECEKWKSYYDLYRQNQELLKKIQGVVNSHPKYGIEQTDTGIIDKDERISFLEVDKQIELIFKETMQECEKLKKVSRDIERRRIAIFKAMCEYKEMYYSCLKQLKSKVVLPPPLPPAVFVNDRYEQALEKIEEIAKQGLKPICYKSNCNRCQCYDGDDSKITITNLINDYFTEDGFVDNDGDFYESLEGLVENERASCNKAKPISEQILTIINEVKNIKGV